MKSMLEKAAPEMLIRKYTPQRRFIDAFHFFSVVLIVCLG